MQPKISIWLDQLEQKPAGVPISLPARPPARLSTMAQLDLTNEHLHTLEGVELDPTLQARRLEQF